MTTKNGKTSNLISEFKNCAKEDFEINGYTSEIAIGVDKLLCPDVEGLKDKYKLRNGYDQRNDRTAISLEIISCNSKFTEGCKKSTEIKKLLEYIYITQYMVSGDIDFDNKANYLKASPINHKFEFQ